jgi:hypothetical protein
MHDALRVNGSALPVLLSGCGSSLLEKGGALVENWNPFEAGLLFSEAAE